MTQSYTHSSQFSSALGSKVREEDPAFSDIIAAISEGKYSWACVLILRSAGYNPLHYMPYRTYNRIIKANLNLGKNRSQSSQSASSKSKGSSDLGLMRSTFQQWKNSCEIVPIDWLPSLRLTGAPLTTKVELRCSMPSPLLLGM